jgi:hypothetical protein
VKKKQKQEKEKIDRQTGRRRALFLPFFLP